MQIRIRTFEWREQKDDPLFTNIFCSQTLAGF